MSKGCVLVAGGAGYIGSHTCKLLAQHGYEPVVLDNLVYGHKEFVKWGDLVVGDIADQDLVCDLIEKYQPVAAFHFAAYTYVGESVTNPQKYYQNNVIGTIKFVDALQKMQVKHLVFSSSCATFGVPQTETLAEDHVQNPINPYGKTKLIIEHCLTDYARAYPLSCVMLRYFNAAGADPDCEIGEKHDPEPHIIPLVLDVALGRRKDITVFGQDYPTLDGTCVRDYIHVNDLALAHILALDYLKKGGQTTGFNLGNGQGFSVKQIIDVAQEVTKKQIAVQYGVRRDGDPARLVGNSAKAKAILGWDPKFASIYDIIETAWRWHQTLA